MGALALVTDHYSYSHFTCSVGLKPALQHVFHLKLFLWAIELCGKHSQVRSLAGAAHLLNDKVGVLMSAQQEQKSHVDQKGRSLLDSHFQYAYKL